MSKSILLFVISLFSLASLKAEITDSLAMTTEAIKTDSIVKVKTKNQKTIDILGVAAPVVMITYGILSVESDAIQQLDYSTKGELNEDNSNTHNTFDNYFQFSPAVAAFALNLCGVKSTHKLSDMCILYALSNILETAVVYTTKSLVTRERPDGSSSNSFPSGHTATAFVAAEFLHQEYKDKSPWISVGGYAMGALIGASRVYNDRHWVSDVVAGAGIGILSTKIVYWTYPSLQKVFSKKDKKLQTILLPSYSNGNISLNLSHTF